MADITNTIISVNDVSIYGKNKVDYLTVDSLNEIKNLSKYERSTSTLNGIFNKDYKPTWIDRAVLNNPIIIADFDNSTIDSNSATGSASSLDIIGYIVFRKEYRYDDDGSLIEVDQVKLTDSISGSSIGIQDYSVKSNCFYQWILYPKVKDGTVDKIGGMASTIFSGDYILKAKAQFETWSVIFLNEIGGKYEFYSQPFIFRCNLQGGTLTQNMDKTQFETYSKYPKISIGEKNYFSGSLSCLLSDVSYRYDETASQKMVRDMFGYNNIFYNEDVYKWNSWCDYIASGKPCLIKDPKGHMFIANILTNSGSEFVKTLDPPTSISFSFVEIGDASDVVVIKEIL